MIEFVMIFTSNQNLLFFSFQTTSINKAINGQENPAKEKHVRRILYINVHKEVLVCGVHLSPRQIYTNTFIYHQRRRMEVQIDGEGGRGGVHLLARSL